MSAVVLHITTPPVGLACGLRGPTTLRWARTGRALENPKQHPILEGCRPPTPPKTIRSKSARQSVPGPLYDLLAVLIGNFNLDSSFGQFSAFFRPNLAPGPRQTGPARKMVQNAARINPGDRLECHFVTFSVPPSKLKSKIRTLDKEGGRSWDRRLSGNLGARRVVLEIVPNYTILYYTILYCTILYYPILYYIIL